MGIVINQSIKNVVITYIGFAIGAANTLFMYPHFLGETFYGLTGYMLSSANIIFPLMAFGIQNTLIKFFSTYKTTQEKNNFISFCILLPIFIIIPIFFIGFLSYDYLAAFLSKKNAIIYNYVWKIGVIGICMGYFEIFYAWVKVHFKSVLGSFLKEILLRIFISIFLFAVYFKWISILDFVNLLVYIYLSIALIMFWYAYKINPIKFSFSFPNNYKSIISYSIFIILSGSIANMLLDIDKTMIGQYIKIENIAYYSVAIFIATVISVPSRSMHQITHPITAKLMNENKHDELNDLYKKTSVSLQVVGGLVFVLIILNIHQLYLLLPRNYAGGVFVVFTIGISKYFDLILGNNNSIIFNSKYYNMVLLLGLLLAFFAIVLNMIFIPIMGINGAAIATMISVSLYSYAKLLFVVKKMKLFPFTIKTLQSFCILIFVFLLFYFWNFQFHPILNIILKSGLITLVYISLHYFFKISNDFNIVLQSIFNKIKSK